MFFKRTIVSCIAALLFTSATFAEDHEIFSGPQSGEALPGFTMKHGFGDEAGEEFDPVESAGDAPLVLIFIHKRTRPAFGLANAVMRYCNQEDSDKLSRGICFLTDDPTATQNWLGKVKRLFPKNTPVGFSPDGIEGPGSYGLNRNVELTILVGKEKKVTSNFALVQPGAHVDGPKILEAIAKVIDSKEKPDINKYLPNNQSVQDTPIAIDPGLMTEIRKLNNKEATDDSVGETLDAIEAMVKDNEPLQKQLGSVLARVVKSKRIDSIGDEEHQAKLRKWAKEYAPKMERMNRRGSDRRQSDSKFTGLLRSVIQKTNTDEQVDAAAKELEKYVAKNPAAEKELARITNTIANSDRLSNYGTTHAQEQIKEWAEKYRPKTNDQND